MGSASAVGPGRPGGGGAGRRHGRGPMPGQHVGPDRMYLDRYERHLHDGHCMILVSVTNQVRKERAARILHNHTNERVTYFGLLSANEVK